LAVVKVGARGVNIAGEYQRFVVFLNLEDGMQVLINAKKIELGQSKLIANGS
jgi:hypothetical protein